MNVYGPRPADSEAQLLERIRQGAIGRGLLAAHCHDSRRNWQWSEGFPDVVVISPAGHGLLFVEVKTTGGQLTRGQQQWRRALEANNVPFSVWRSPDWTTGEIDARLALLAGS